MNLQPTPLPHLENILLFLIYLKMSLLKMIWVVSLGLQSTHNLYGSLSLIRQAAKALTILYQSGYKENE